MMDTFDLLGPLPEPKSTTVLQASAGTGKTFALAGLVARYLAETDTRLDEMLLITFNQAASRELRERVRGQLASAVVALDAGQPTADNPLLAHLLRGSAAERELRQSRLADALSAFDTATIATIHEFCSVVLKSLGVAGDTAAEVKLQESLDDLIAEVASDRYLVRFGHVETDPVLTYSAALELSRQVVREACAELRPHDPDPATEAGVRRQFADDVLAELEHRKGKLGIQGFNDLLTRLAAALERADSGARNRMRARWRIVMVDEFQDTDPIQWQVLDRAFTGHATVILIGDPKQAIYGFRGGDIHTYLRAVHTADREYTLDVNWRSDQALVDSLQAVLCGAALGHPDIVVYPVQAAHTGHRLAGAPHNAAFRLRVVLRDTVGYSGTAEIPIDMLRRHITADLAADIGQLVNSGATLDGRRVGPGDIAIIVERHQDARMCRDALAEAGIPAVYTGDSDVFAAPAADDWLCLLEAFDQPHRSGLVRAAATTAFFGHTAEELARESDTLTDRVAATLGEWTEHTRVGVVAAVFEDAKTRGMGQRLLSQHGGERQMTDLAHIAELLQEAAHRERLGLPGLLDWLRRQRNQNRAAIERNRRMDSDTAAVQIMTVFVAKGLQFPIVYLPFMFRRHVRSDDVLLYHDENDTRCLYIGGTANSTDRSTAAQLNRRDAARDNIRLTYVALTRAQSQLVAWWAPAKDEISGGLSRLLRGRQAGQADVPERCPSGITDDDALAVFRAWESAGGPAVESSVIAPPSGLPAPEPVPALAIRQFNRKIDTSWRRTSYSALIRGAVHPVTDTGVRSEPEVTGRDDEPDDGVVFPAPTSSGAGVVSPMVGMPGGKAFGSLVHAVLEHADPFAADLAAEFEAQVRTHQAWWPVDVDPAVLAAALVPMHDTPLGPLGGGLTLRRIGMRDRLRELGFEIPLADGDTPGTAPGARLADVAALLREYLPADDPFTGYTDRLGSDALGGQSLRGYLAGSLDVVLRLADQRYLVVDYKTNHLGDTAADYSFDRLAAAMVHSDYPLQALLYVAVLHRFLRWRQPSYDPQRHLGGVLYLFVRGMCGPATPTFDGHPAGVFSWRPPAALVAALSDLLHAGRSAT